jgi:spore maturation protein SpmB
VLAAKAYQGFSPQLPDEIEQPIEKAVEKTAGMSGRSKLFLGILALLFAGIAVLELGPKSLRADLLRQSGLSTVMEKAAERKATAAKVLSEKKAEQAAIAVPPEPPVWRRAMDGASGLAIPAILLAAVGLAWARGVRVYEEFVEGAKEGFQVAVRDWTQVNRNWFESVQLQRRMLALILTLIVAVAAFNLVSTLVMTVTDKRGEIAILRTLGASPASVMAIFVVQGLLAGLVGTAAGVALGLLVASNLDVWVPALERLLGTRLLSPSVYLLDHLPSLPKASDVVPVAVVSLMLSLLATLYPSWRASRLQPAAALRGE